MTINELTHEECSAFLARASFGHLGCSLNDQPYVVPIYLEYDDGYLYVLSTQGQKMEWMRQNPKICVQIDEIKNEEIWTSIVVNGTFQELPEPQFTRERAHARKLLEKRVRWWEPALAERQLKSVQDIIEPLFFRIHIDSVSGFRAAE
jgi:nitroimidazol reductase NimA-like FMN-containing flavoprotein (pyridoxamine 5'-phosphate oxidase superfamily)